MIIKIKIINMGLFFSKMLIILVCLHQCNQMNNLEEKLQSNYFILLEFREKKE